MSSSPRYHLSTRLLEQTFEHFRTCGRGSRECQVLWTSRWERLHVIDEVVHPLHEARCGGFELDSKWLTTFWLELARRSHGIRVQVHTHPREAFHSDIDDAFPVVHAEGFLSLVIPNFGLGPVGFERAYLARIDGNGKWREASIASHFEIMEE